MLLKTRKKKPFFADEIISAFSDIKLHSEELPTHIELFSGESELSKLSVKKNQIIFGRRGTGKSHFLQAFNQKTNKSGENCLSIYISLLEIVSGTPQNVDSYENEAKSRYISNIYYKRFLEKVVELLMTEGLSFNGSKPKNSAKAESILSNNILGEILNGSEIVTYTSKKITEEEKREKNKQFGIGAGLSLKELSLKLGLSKGTKKSNVENATIQKHISYQTDVSKLRESIDEYLQELGIDTLYICIDEWSELDKSCNTTIQQKFAQKLKQTFFKSPRISVKIASIWTMTEMNNKSLAGRFFGGIEIGQDIFKEVDLDTTFFSSYDSICDFLANLVYKRFIFNFNGKAKDFKKFESPIDFLIEEIFETKENFKTLVSASHGIPRDFLQLFNRCFLKIERNISEHAIDKDVIFQVAIEYYKNEKRNLISGNEIIIKFIDKIDNYLENRIERFFLLPNKSIKNSPEINELVDKKFIHQLPSSLINRNIRNKYKVFLIDYGSFWEWLSSRKKSYDIKPISPVLEIKDSELKEINEFILDIGDLPTSYLFCENCYEFFSPTHPVFERFKACPKCAGEKIKNLKDAKLN